MIHAPFRLRATTLALMAALAVSFSAQAAKFTYHGELMDGDAPAEGAYDLRVRSYADQQRLRPLGEATEVLGVTLTEGSFSAQFDLLEDTDGVTWIDVAVRKSATGGEYVTLGDAQPMPTANSTCPGAWALDGNSGAPAGSFLGFVDNQPLVLKANTTAVAMFTPRGTASDFGDAPTVAFGSSANVASGIGATVGGGGAPLSGGGHACSGCKNTANGNFSTVSGGVGNTASDGHGTVSGGIFNTASGGESTISGGLSNKAGGTASTVGGGRENSASGYSSTVGGGVFNTASGGESTVSGGHNNCAGGFRSWAGGYRAKIRPGTGSGASGDGCFGVASSGTANGDEGTFVWADSQFINFTSTGPNQFLIRADGGVAINTARFGNAADLRQSELVIRNSTSNGNADITLLNTTNRGYNLVSVPGTGGAAGDFYIGETDARTAAVGYTNRLRIDANGTTFVQGGAVGNLSDARLKKNLAPIQKPLDTLLALSGQMFEYLDPAASMNTPGPRMGFIAQDVQQVIPGWVKPTGEKGHLAVTPVGFEALTVEAIRDLKAESDMRIAHLEDENAALHEETTALRATLDAVLARLARLEAGPARP